MMQDENRVALLYVRVSTPQQAEEGVSLDAQESQLRTLARLHTADLPVQVLRDEGKSARAGKTRPKYDEARQLIREGRVAAIYATKVDRFGRNVHEYLSFLADCYDNETAVFTTSGQVENSATGRLLSNVLASIAQFESDLRRERITDAYDHIRPQGLWRGGSVPIGYERGPDRVLVQTEDAPRVREAFQRAERGDSFHKIARDLDWNRRTLRKVLSNRHYAGWIVDGDRLHEGRHEPIVSRDRFWKVQERLQQQVRESHSAEQVNPFGSLIRCDCGGRMRLKSRVARAKTYTYYYCDACRESRVAAFFELAVVSGLYAYATALREVLANPSELTTATVDADEEAQAAYADQLSRIEDSIQNIVTLIADGALRHEDASPKLSELYDHRAKLQRACASLAPTSGQEARAVLEAVSAELEPLRELSPLSENAYIFWRASTVEQKRAFLTRTVRQIELQNDHVQISFRRGDTTIRLPLNTGKRTPLADTLDSILAIRGRGEEGELSQRPAALASPPSTP